MENILPKPPQRNGFMGCLKRLALLETRNFRLRMENNRLRMVEIYATDTTVEAIRQRNEAVALIQKLTRDISDCDDLEQRTEDMEIARQWVRQGSQVTV